MVEQLSHVLYQGKQNTAVSKEHIHQVLPLKISLSLHHMSFRMQRNSALLTSKMTLKVCVKSKHLPLLHALKFPFLVHLYAAFLFDQVVQRTWAVPERHLLVHIFHHPENIANMFLIMYLKNKAVSLYCRRTYTFKAKCSLCPFQTNSKCIFTPVKPARALKSILFYSMNSSDFDFYANIITALTSQTYFRKNWFLLFFNA